MIFYFKNQMYESMYYFNGYCNTVFAIRKMNNNLNKKM